MIFNSLIPVSPVYINRLVLLNGKSLPTFVNHTIIQVMCDLYWYILNNLELQEYIYSYLPVLM